MSTVKTEYTIKQGDIVIGEIKVWHSYNRVTITCRVKLKKHNLRIILKELEAIKNIANYEIQFLDLSCF